MAPKFALFLSPEGIALAHQQPSGQWAILGDTPLTAEDLPGELTRLRGLAEERAEGKFKTLILLPDDQLLFTSLTAPGPSEAEIVQQIEAGLDGLTPYAVSELAYDYAKIDDGRVKLAVVARETLEEAEEFAKSNGFKAAGFGARPLDNRYPGVAHFDRSKAWVSEIPDIEFGLDVWRSAEADTQAAEVAQTPDEITTEPPAAPDDAPTDVVPEESAELAAPDAPPSQAPAQTGFVSRRNEAEGANTPPGETNLSQRASRITPAGDADDMGDTTEPSAPEKPKAEHDKQGKSSTETAHSEPVFGRSARGESASEEKPDRAAPTRPKAAGPAPVLPPLARVKSQVRAERPTATQGATTPKAPNPFWDKAEAETPDGPTLSQRMSGLRDRLNARRNKKAEAAPPADQPEPAGAIPAPATAGRKATAKPAKTASKPARNARGPLKIIRAQAAEEEQPDGAVMGGLLSRGFGAANRGPTLKAGLFLTLILLALLGVVALWAAFYLPDSALSRAFGLGRSESELAETSPVTDTTNTDNEIAALAPEGVIELPDIDAELPLPAHAIATPLVDPETVLPSPEENQSFYDSTGIWQRPPVVRPPQPEPGVGSIVLAGLDPVIASLDAIALPAPMLATARDLPDFGRPAGQSESGVPSNPADLVAPSAEGTLAPYGVRIIAGPPPVTPRLRPREVPELASQLSLEEVATLATVGNPARGAPDAPSDTSAPVVTPGAVTNALLAGFRPETRPDDLREQHERYNLGGITFAELARIRPATRPLSVQELAAQERAAQAEAAQSTEDSIAAASDLAVAVSTLPASRPGNIATLVAAARAAGNSGPTGPVVANRSDAVQPSIPSNASVTRAATQENVLNLRRVNLIGVSGTAAARRALVRMPSGRFRRNVEVGDRLDGGRVVAISQSALQYVKNGRTITLEVVGS